jgi:hypothetical protein
VLAIRRELRDKVRAELIKKIEDPIRRKCQKFVADQQDSGTGVRLRILDLFDELGEEVVEAAAAPAISLLVERFHEVDKEILAAFGEHSEPLTEATEALIQRHENHTGQKDEQAVQLALSIEAAVAAMPSEVAQSRVAAA